MLQVRCGYDSSSGFSLKWIVENPWTAAQRFLQANELPLSYLDEVVRFIEKNTAGVSLGGGDGQYSDPFTGTNLPYTYSGMSLISWKGGHDTSRPVAVCRTRTSVATLSPEPRDISPLQIPQPHHTPGEEIHSPGHLGTNRRFHRPIKADTRIRSQELIDTNRHLLPGLRPLHLAPLRQLRPRVISSLTYVQELRAGWRSTNYFSHLENADHLQAVQYPCNAGKVDGAEPRSPE